jgi:hypothetical protein
MRAGGPSQWCGPKRVAVGHRVARQRGDWCRRRGVPCDAAGGGRGSRGDGAKSGPGDSRRWLRHPADEINEGSKSGDEQAEKHGDDEPPPDPVGATAAGAAAWRRSVRWASDSIGVS